MNHHVDHAMLVQILGALEAFGQLLADRVLDDTLAGESDQGPRLSDVNVTQHRVARRDATRRGISQDNDIRQTSRFQSTGHHGCSRHLHKAEDAFLHARSTRCSYHNVRAVAAQRFLCPVAERLADRHAHRSAHKAEILDPHHGCAAINRARADNKRVFVSAFCAGSFDPVSVFLAIAELEGIFGYLGLRQQIVSGV